MELTANFVGMRSAFILIKSVPRWNLAVFIKAMTVPIDGDIAAVVSFSWKQRGFGGVACLWRRGRSGSDNSPGSNLIRHFVTKIAAVAIFAESLAPVSRALNQKTGWREKHLVEMLADSSSVAFPAARGAFATRRGARLNTDGNSCTGRRNSKKFR